MSPSSEARIWSRLTFGFELASGIVQPSGISSVFSVPGVELDRHVLQAGPRPQQRRGVRDGSAARTRGRPRIVTTATPSSSSTPVTSPISTPERFTVWPWPGVTAWAVWNSVLSSKRSSPRIGNQRRQRRCSAGRGSRTASRARSPPRTMIAMKSRVYVRSAFFTGPRERRRGTAGAPTAACGPFRSGGSFWKQWHVGRGPAAPSTGFSGWVPIGACDRAAAVDVVVRRLARRGPEPRPRRGRRRAGRAGTGRCRRSWRPDPACAAVRVEELAEVRLRRSLKWSLMT